MIATFKIKLTLFEKAGSIKYFQVAFQNREKSHLSVN